MIALDTNVLVRLLIADDAGQLALAHELLESTFAAGENALVSDPVLCELEWVLDSCYRVPRRRVVELFQELLANPHLEFESRTAFQRALSTYETGKADFSDYLIAQIARARDARVTYTFDRALRDSEDFVVLGSRS